MFITHNCNTVCGGRMWMSFPVLVIGIDGINLRLICFQKIFFTKKHIYRKGKNPWLRIKQTSNKPVNMFFWLPTYFILSRKARKLCFSLSISHKLSFWARKQTKLFLILIQFHRTYRGSFIHCFVKFVSIECMFIELSWYEGMCGHCCVSWIYVLVIYQNETNIKLCFLS